MKYLSDFRIFESDDEHDEDSKIPSTGFQYSFDDIKDSLWDILDLGFKITKKSHSYWVEDFNTQSPKSKLTDAKWAVWELRLEADLDCETITKYQTTVWRNSSSILKDSNLELEIFQSIADIRSRFQKVYHSLEILSDYGLKKWVLFITILSEIDVDEIEQARFQEKQQTIKDEISSKVQNFIKKVRNIGTTKFRELSSKNKLGESSWSGLGKISQGYICMFINTTEMTKQVKLRSFEEIETSLNSFKSWYFPQETTIELRKITIEDCKKISEIHNTTLEYMQERYLGLDAIFVEYDFEKWFRNLSK